MNSGRRVFLIFCFLVFALGGVCGQEETEGIHTLLWKMAVLKKSGSAYESVPFRRTTLTLIKNDAFKIYLGFESTGYCYIVQENDEGRLPVVYRKNVSPGDRLTLPPDVLGERVEEKRDFRARDLPGTNRFYVIVSAQPKQNLERLIEQHEQEPTEASLERSILSEVLAIRRSVSSHSGNSAESDHSRQDRQGSLPAHPGVTVPPTETDPAMKGELRLFEGREAWVVTITIRVQ